MTPCACGTPYLELPVWATFRNHYDHDGNFEGETMHMFRGCQTCRDTFCTCGKTHPVPQGRKVTHV